MSLLVSEFIEKPYKICDMITPKLSSTNTLNRPPKALTNPQILIFEALDLGKTNLIFLKPGLMQVYTV